MDIYDIFPRGLDFGEALNLLEPVVVYVFSMAAYALFVFRFYRFVATRDIFELDLSRYEESRFRLVRLFLHFILYVGKYLILFPVFAFFWFAILTVILTFLSENRTFPDILLMALVTVSTIRVTSYLSEDLSRDLAKILPFGVLAIFIIDASFFSVVASLDVLRDIRDYSERILYYLLFLIALEFAVRLIMGFAKFVLVRGKEPAPEEPEPGPSVEGAKPQGDAEATAGR